MAVLSLYTTSCNEDKNKAVILVRSAGLEYPVKLFKVDTTGSWNIDSIVKPSDKDIRFIVSIAEPTAFNLTSNESQTTFILEAGDTVIVDLSIPGGIQNENPRYADFREFVKARHSLDRKADTLATLFINAQVTDSFAIVRERVAGEFTNLLSEARSLSTSFILNNPESIGVFVAFNSTFKKYQVFDYSVNPEIFRFADSVMQQYHPAHRYSIRMHNLTAQLERKYGKPKKDNIGIKQGDSLAPIEYPGLKNQSITLNTPEGEIGLIYLWDESSVSRKTTLKVKMVNEKYKGKGIATYAIFFGTSRRNWTSLIELDKMWWNNMIDTAASGSQFLKTYNIRRLPYFIVIDDNRTVLAHFVTAEALEEWLSLHFKDNK
jgi:hypothetical protein